MKLLSLNRLESINLPVGWTRCWPFTAAAAMALTADAVGAKPGGGDTAPPPSTALYSMERISQPGWGHDYQVENLSGRGDAAGVTIIKSGRNTLAGQGFFWDSTTKLNSRLLPLPTTSTGAIVHNASWAGGISDDGRIIFGASLRSAADVVNLHQDFTPVVWINTGASSLAPLNLEPRLQDFADANLTEWGFASFAPDFGPLVSQRFTGSGEFLYLNAVTAANYSVDVVARLSWTDPADPPQVTGMWALGLRRTETVGGYNGDAFSIAEGTRPRPDGAARRVVSIAGYYREFDEKGQPTTASAAALGRIPMNWELDVDSGVASWLALSHLDPPVDYTTGWGIDVNAVGATVGLAKAAGEDYSDTYYWTPDGNPIRPAPLPGSNDKMRLYALNAAGTAVGNTTTGTNSNYVAVLWSAHSNTAESLAALAGGSVSFEQAIDINENGQIAVLDAASPSRWYVLTPKP